MFISVCVVFAVYAHMCMCVHAQVYIHRSKAGAQYLLSLCLIPVR